MSHDLCNAILFAEVLCFNTKQVSKRFVDIAKAMGIDVAGMTQEQAVDACSLTNPRTVSLDEIIEIFKARM